MTDTQDKLHGNTKYCVTIFPPDPIYYVVPSKSLSKVKKKSDENGEYYECQCAFTVDLEETDSRNFTGRILFQGIAFKFKIIK